MSEAVEQFTLPRSLYDRLLEEARQALPNECCGLLGGRDERATGVFPATNALASPTAYEIAPRELFEIFRRMRAEGLTLVGIYHSHPAGENLPSLRDREQAYYPEAAYLIISLAETVSTPIRAFRMHGEGWREFAVAVTD